MRQESEPSVGQILQSIKRVMARDRRPADDAPEAEELLVGDFSQGKDEGKDEDEGGGDPAADPADEEEAADLHEFALPEALFPAEAEQLLAGPDHERLLADSEDELILTEDLIEDEGDGEAEVFGEVEPAPAFDPAPRAAADPGLASESATDSMRRSLSALAMLAQPGAPLPTTPAGAASLDAIVREMLRPMLAQWLDTHLPALVEREVKAEIARITGPGGG